MNTDGPLVTEPNGNGKRKRLLISAGLIFLIIGLAWIAYWFFISRYHQSTDDAYVAGDIVQITPQVNGTVVSIDAEDTDYVMPGKILVKLNPDDAEVALQQAEAQLAQAVRQARTLYSNDKALIANIDERRAELQNAQAEAEKARLDLHRREVLAPAGAVSKEELQHARVAVDNALNVVAAAKSNLAGNEEHLVSSQALTEGTSVENQPSVQQAAAHMKEAYLARVRCDIASPVEGQVAKRNVQIGQRVQTGAPLMAIIPLKQVWVDANFKEDQLHNMRIGQPVHLYSDLYGDNIEYLGKIAGLGAGTGAAFSLLPAQNATGNWIKIVQRIPVRIALDPSQLKKYPLRVGLSMQAKVDTQDTNGKLLSDTPRTQPVSMTNIQDNQAAHAEALVKSVIEKNLGSHKALNPSGTRALSSASKSSASGKS
ncbi:MAG: HlyD family efflux transporter periplasmic adaptor subunit [Pseudomonadota bacterium]